MSIGEDPGGAPIIVKMGGEVVASEGVHVLAADIVAIRKTRGVILVHGGGPQASKLQEQLGQKPVKVAGRRVTDEATLDVMKMVVAGKLNVDLAAALVRAGGKPIGLSGASSLVIEAARRPPKVYAGAGDAPVDLGLVGDVIGVNAELVSLLLANGYIPTLACLGCDAGGQVYNINADTVATRLAVTLGAAGLVLVSDVGGVLRDVADKSSRIPSITRAEGKALIASGVVRDGMIPKLEESFAAIDEGARAVHIVGKLGPGDLAREIATPGSVGTVLLP